MDRPNAVVAQSGGPTSVVNTSIHGAVNELLKSNEVNRVYGAKMGILGVLREELIDISAQDDIEIERLSNTPSAGVLGSCRYKIKSQEDMDRIVEVFKSHNIGYFLYCGGEDSMDTANKIAKLAKQKGLDLTAVGIPKTIDNDLGGQLNDKGTFDLCDHDPGYGSVARNTAINILEANEENKASYTSDPVLIIGVMGRKIGFIPAAARLADPKREMPLLIVLPESLTGTPKENLEFLNEKINEKLREAKRCIVVIGEGVNLGDLDILKDSFGHSQFSAAGKTVEQLLSNYLNGLDRKDISGKAKSRLIVSGIARYEKPGTRQRREIAYVSSVDLRESYEVGKKAAKLALERKSGYMASIIRNHGNLYEVSYDAVPIEMVANTGRCFPSKWISENKVDVTDEFIKWAMPLIGEDLPVFSKFKEIYAKKVCHSYTPFEFRGE